MKYLSTHPEYYFKASLFTEVKCNFNERIYKTHSAFKKPIFCYKNGKLFLKN